MVCAVRVPLITFHFTKSANHTRFVGQGRCAVCLRVHVHMLGFAHSLHVPADEDAIVVSSGSHRRHLTQAIGGDVQGV